MSLVHGVPRALEVMAGILANDPFASLAEVIEQFYEQQDVVQALIEENYKRLDNNARWLIEALAVFKRPVLPLAVDYLLEPFVPGLDVPGILRRLTHTNIVSIDRATKTISLHPIDQDYAYSQLPEEGDYSRPTLERRAADYYVQLRTSEETWKTIDDLEPQLAEFEHRVRAGDHNAAGQILDLIDYGYLYKWGHYAKLVGLRQKIQGHLTDPYLRMTTLHSLGNAYRAFGRFEQAIKFYQEALTIGDRSVNRVSEKADILGHLGRAYRALGQIEQALQCYEKALVIAREANDRQQEAIQLGHLGLAYRALGQVRPAIGYYEQSLAIAREIGDRQGEADYLASLGSAHHNLGQIEPAVKLYRESLAIAREVGNRRTEGYNLVSLGDVYQDLCQIEQAIEFYKQALAIARETGHRPGEGVDLGHLGRTHHALGQIDQAIGYFEQALAVTGEIGDRREEGLQLGYLGQVYNTLGKVEQAIAHYEKALHIARETKDRRQESIWLTNLGCAYHTQGKVEEAIRCHEESLIIAREIEDHLWVSHCLVGLGSALLSIKKISSAQVYCIEALDLSMPTTSYHAALILGIALLHQYDSTANELFSDAATRCQTLLSKTAGLYQIRYALGTILVGQAVANSGWAEQDKRATLLAPALTEYQRALDICAAPGVIQDAILDLELIQAAGIEGLEPVFELLTSALEKQA